MGSPVYLLLSLWFLGVVAVCIVLRRDLFLHTLKIGVAGGIAGILVEYWHFADYWRPTPYFGAPFMFVEDFLFGFVVAGMAVVLFPLLRQARRVTAYPPQRTRFILLMALAVAVFLLGITLLGINSVIISIIIFLSLTAAMLVVRRDLIVPSIVSGGGLVLVTFPAYLFLTNVVDPSYIDSVWLLKDTVLGVRVLGNVPLTELAWYLSCGMCIGIVHEFLKGRGFVRALET